MLVVTGRLGSLFVSYSPRGPVVPALSAWSPVGGMFALYGLFVVDYVLGRHLMCNMPAVFGMLVMGCLLDWPSAFGVLGLLLVSGLPCMAAVFGWHLVRGMFVMAAVFGGSGVVGLYFLWGTRRAVFAAVMFAVTGVLGRRLMCGMLIGTGVPRMFGFFAVFGLPCVAAVVGWHLVCVTLFLIAVFDRSGAVGLYFFGYMPRVLAVVVVTRVLGRHVVCGMLVVTGVLGRPLMCGMFVVACRFGWPRAFGVLGSHAVFRWHLVCVTLFMAAVFGGSGVVGLYVLWGMLSVLSVFLAANMFTVDDVLGRPLMRGMLVVTGELGWHRAFGVRGLHAVSRWYPVCGMFFMTGNRFAAGVFGRRPLSRVIGVVGMPSGRVAGLAVRSLAVDAVASVPAAAQGFGDLVMPGDGRVVCHVRDRARAVDVDGLDSRHGGHPSL